jgi:hypothetical protein
VPLEVLDKANTKDIKAMVLKTVPLNFLNDRHDGSNYHVSLSVECWTQTEATRTGLGNISGIASKASSAVLQL